MAICTSFTSFIMVISVQYDEGLKVDPAVMFWIVVDCMVSAMSIFLLFSWSNHIYYKLCHVLHKKCEKSKKRKMSQSEIDINKKCVKGINQNDIMSKIKQDMETMTTGHHDVISETFDEFNLMVLPKLANSQSEPSDMRRFFASLTMTKTGSTTSWSPETNNN
eukprot:812831_1